MQFIFITWNHVLREANQVADVLAKQAIMALNHFQVLRFLLHVLSMHFEMILLMFVSQEAAFGPLDGCSSPKEVYLFSE